MTDTPPPKRRFWQIHFSTAVICSFYIALAMPLLLWWYRFMLDKYTWEADTEPLFPWVKPVAILVVMIFLGVPALFIAFVCEYLIRRRSKS
jgi:hypothetical protein